MKLNKFLSFSIALMIMFCGVFLVACDDQEDVWTITITGGETAHTMTAEEIANGGYITPPFGATIRKNNRVVSTGGSYTVSVGPAGAEMYDSTAIIVTENETRTYTVTVTGFYNDVEIGTKTVMLAITKYQSDV